MVIAAFDYSLTCPCLCLATSDKWVDAKFWFLSDVKKNQTEFLQGRIKGKAHGLWKTDEERHHNISEHFLNIVRSNCPAGTPVVIEDYSMGSKGRVFNLAENTGLMKHKLWTHDYPITKVAPTSLKKFATGKGNAKKEQMWDAFFTMTGETLESVGKKGGNPTSDIIDSWFLVRYGYTLTV
jgi:Holliday junction resolvasome RuvABC endonuclease subunit